MLNSTIENAKMSTAASENVAETGLDLADDIRLVLAGMPRADMLALCLAGSDDDRVVGWHDYVDWLYAHAE